VRSLLCCALLGVSVLAVGVDVSGLHSIHDGPVFSFYSEDERDYSDLIEFVEARNAELEAVFETSIESPITVYIFESQTSFWRHVFGGPPSGIDASGFADHVSRTFYLTSPYDPCRTRDVHLRTAIHELVHLYFPCATVWIREGIAHYYSDMLVTPTLDDLPGRISDLHFYAQTNEETRTAYNISAWIVKFIIEELCWGNLDTFRGFARNPSDYSLIGLQGEEELFQRWSVFMRIQISDSVSS
jgi:hypothetical protein